MEESIEVEMEESGREEGRGGDEKGGKGKKSEGGGEWRWKEEEERGRRGVKMRREVESRRGERI